MEFEEKPRMQDDVLKILRILAVDVNRTKIMKLIMIILLSVHIVMIIIQIYFMINVFNKMELIKYSPFFVFTFYLVTTLVLVLTTDDLVGDAVNDLELWSISSGGPDVERQIKYEAKMITIYTVSNYVMVTITGLTFAMPNQYDSQFFFGVMFLTEYLPKTYGTILVYVFKSTVFIGMYLVILHPGQAIYYTQHIKFQVMMLLKLASELPKFDGHLTDDERVHNAEYQKEIRRRLKFCIMRHIQLLRMGRLKVEKAKPLAALYMLNTVLMGISLLLYCFTGKFFLNAGVFFRVISAVMLACMTFVGTLMATQSIETITDEINAIVKEMEWYYFDFSNKSSFLIILINNIKPFKIYVSQNYALNYELAIHILKGIFSVMSLLATFNKIQY